MKKSLDSYFYKTFFRLFGVVALQNIIVFGVNLADSIMLGRYSETAMSGVSLANQYQFLLHMLVSGCANGVVVIASQYWGKKDTASIKKVLACGFAVCTGISAVMTAAVLISPAGILGLLSNETAIVSEGAEYIRILAFSYLIFAVTNILIAVLRSVESVSIGFYTSLAALFINIFLNYTLIFGHFGAPEMGVKGAAAATLISRIAECLIVLVYAFFIDRRLKLRPRDFIKIEKSYFGDYVKAGLPLMGSSGSWGIAMLIQTAIIGRLGEAAIGANAVAAPIFQVVSVLYSSSSSASSVLIGKTVGEGDIPRVKLYAKRLQVMFLITGIISCAGMLLLKNSLLGFYDISDETLVMSRLFINILAVTVMGSSYEAPCLCGIVSGGGETNFVFKNDIIFMWCIVLPAAFLSAFVFRWSVPVTFFILKSDQILKCAVAAVKVNRFRWIRTLTREA